MYQTRELWKMGDPGLLPQPLLKIAENTCARTTKSATYLMLVSKVGKYIISMVLLSGPWRFFAFIFCLFRCLFISLFFGGGVFHPGWLSVLIRLGCLHTRGVLQTRSNQRLISAFEVQ